MKQTEYREFRKLLMIGLIASVVTVIGGELPIGWVTNPASDNPLLSTVLGYGKLSLVQLAYGAFFGGIAIPLQYYGFEGVSRILSGSGSKKAGKLVHWGGLACAFWGGIVHMICVALMFLCKAMEVQALTQPVMDFFLWLVMPISMVFMPIYYAMCIAMAVPILKGNTPFPKWAAIFNPLTAGIALNILPMIAPNCPLVNGLGMANMGIGSVLTFGGLLALLKPDTK